MTRRLSGDCSLKKTKPSKTASSDRRTQQVSIEKACTKKLAQHLLNVNLDGIAMFSPIKNHQDNIIDFHILYLNPASEQILKRPTKKLVDDTLLNVFPGTKKTPIFSLFSKVYQTGIPDTEEVFYGYEGFSDWFILKAARSEDILIVYFERINQPRYLKNQPLQNSFKLNKTILEYILQEAPIGISLIDKKGRLYCLNDHYCKMYGYECDELCGTSFLNIMPQELRPYWKEEYQKFLKDHQNHPFYGGIEAVRVRKDGSRFNVWFSPKVIILPNGEKATIHIVIDLSERKRLENALLALHDQKQVELGHALHEGLCQELSSLSLFSEILHKKIKSGKDVKKDVSEITTMLQGMLEYTRDLSHSLSIEIGWNNFAAMMNNLKSIAEKKRPLTCQMKFSMPKQKKNIQHVPQQLYFIAQEAITNAVKHGRAKNIKISLKQLKSYIIFTINSDGKPFKPSQHSEKKGLGIHIMKFRTEHLNGSFSIQAGKKDGTVVQCRIPTKKAS